MRNWAGTYEYEATEVHRPATLEQVREIVAAAPRIRVLGSRHSFNDIGDSGQLLSLDDLAADVTVDAGSGQVSLNPATRYGELAQALAPHGLALANLASLPHISVAGAVATATHGSGETIGNLATQVAGLELVTSDGELVTARRGDPSFAGMVVGLGALGAVTRMTLDVEPAYEVRQDVLEDVPWEVLTERFDDIAASAYSVSAFTRFGPALDMLWLKRRAAGPPEEGFGGRWATAERNPVVGEDPVNATQQHGVPGPWSDRLPHFRMGFKPSRGDELQSEYHVPRERVAETIAALRALGDRLRPLTLVCELRLVAADDLWMSPQHGRDTLAVHFTWRPQPGAVREALLDVEAALGPLGARPHWGKVFVMRAAERYERLDDFRALAQRLDPRGAFRNAWVERNLL
jgi:xylitol oxidase